MRKIAETLRPLGALGTHLTAHTRLFVRVVVVAWLLMIAGMAVAVLSVHGAATVLQDGGSAVSMTALTAAVLAVGALSWTDSWISHVLAYRVIDTIRLAVHAALARLAPLGLGRRRSGETAAAAMSDAEQLEWFFAHTVAQIVAGAAAALSVTIGAVMWLGTPGLIVLAGQLALFAVPIAGLPVAGRQGTELRHRVSSLSGASVEMRQAARDLVLLDRMDDARSSLRSATAAVQRVRRSIAVRTGAEQAVIDLVSTSTMLAMVVVIGWRVADGTTPAAHLPVAVVLAQIALSPVLTIVASMQRIAEMAAAAARISELIDGAPPSRPPAVAASRNDAQRDRGRLTVTGLRVSYPGTPPVLDRLDLHLADGEHVALVGASGAGKTTLVHALVRLIEPTAGSIVISGTNVVDESPEETRRRISLVDQHPHMFRASVRDNMVIARGGADDTRLWRVLDDVGLGDHVRTLPDGLDTVLAEHGRTWSGGQRQRLGLARGILRDPDVLILDEPTANLDQHAERAFMERALHLRQGRTTIVISHRAATIAHFSRVLVLANGAVEPDAARATDTADPHTARQSMLAPATHPSTQ